MSPIADVYADLAHRRLANQRLVGTPAPDPVEAVRRLGAVQAQDFAAAKWGVARRARGCTDADVEAAFARGAILRTHVLRPTWHFVAPADIRWMLALTAPRVHAASAGYRRRNGLDAEAFRRSDAALGRALARGEELTREELVAVLERAGIRVTAERMVHLLMHAELEGVICSGGRRGKQLTYALLEARAPRAKTLPRDEALAELTRRYFASHGPAEARDFAWWSGLRIADAEEGLRLAGSALAHRKSGRATYWFEPGRAPARRPALAVHLLPNYDEYLVGYRDHGFAAAPGAASRIGLREGIYSNHTVVVNGRVAGSWRRTLGARAAVLELRLLRALGHAERAALDAEAERYGRFLGVPVTLSRPSP